MSRPRVLPCQMLPGNGTGNGEHSYEQMGSRSLFVTVFALLAAPACSPDCLRVSPLISQPQPGPDKDTFTVMRRDPTAAAAAAADSAMDHDGMVMEEAAGSGGGSNGQPGIAATAAIAAAGGGCGARENLMLSNHMSGLSVGGAAAPGVAKARGAAAASVMAAARHTGGWGCSRDL